MEFLSNIKTMFLYYLKIIKKYLRIYK